MSAIRSFRTLQRNCIRLHFLCMDRFLSSLSSAMETHSRLKRKENQINGFYSSLLIFSFNFFAVFVLTSILISGKEDKRGRERDGAKKASKRYSAQNWKNQSFLVMPLTRVNITKHH